jgi:hypothetical protein
MIWTYVLSVAAEAVARSKAVLIADSASARARSSSYHDAKLRKHERLAIGFFLAFLAAAIYLGVFG